MASFLERVFGMVGRHRLGYAGKEATIRAQIAVEREREKALEAASQTEEGVKIELDKCRALISELNRQLNRGAPWLFLIWILETIGFLLYVPLFHTGLKVLVGEFWKSADNPRYREMFPWAPRVWAACDFYGEHMWLGLIVVPLAAVLWYVQRSMLRWKARLLLSLLVFVTSAILVLVFVNLLRGLITVP